MESQITIRLPETLRRRLDRVAKSVGRRNSVFTLDHRGFSVYRLHGQCAFQIVP